MTIIHPFHARYKEWVVELRRDEKREKRRDGKDGTSVDWAFLQPYFTLKKKIFSLEVAKEVSFVLYLYTLMGVGA